MLKIKFLIIAAFIMSSLGSFSLYGQIGEEIRSYVDSSEIVLKNGRRLLLNSLREHNYDKAGEVYLYLRKEMDNKPYDAFNYEELLYINMILGNWSIFADKAKNFKVFIQNSTYPETYPLIDPLYKIVLNRNDQILENLNNSKIDDQGQKVAALFLHLIKQQQTDETYDEMYRAFMRQYSNSAYNDFLTLYLPRPSLYLAWSWSIGAHAMATTGSLERYFPSGVGGFMAMDLNYRELYTSLFVGFATLDLKKEFIEPLLGVDTEFNKGENFSYGQVDIKGGYFILRNDRFHLAAFFNLGGAWLQSTRFDPEDGNDPDIYLFNTFKYGPGLHAEVKLGEWNYQGGYMGRVPAKHYVSIKFEAVYNFLNKAESTKFNGDIYNVNLGLVWGFGHF